MQGIETAVGVHGARFGFESVGKHPVNTAVDTVVQLPAGHIDADLHDVEPARAAHAGPQLRIGQSGQQANLQSPDDTRGIAAVHFGVIGRIERPKLFGKPLHAFGRQPRGEIPPQGFVGLRKVVHAFAQGADIESGAADGHDVIVCGKQFAETRQRLRLIFAAVQVVIYVMGCNKMMLNSLQLFGRRLGRADRQPTVDLPRIGRENRGVVVERKADAQVRLARSRRSHDDDKPFVTHRRNCRPLRNR